MSKHSKLLGNDSEQTSPTWTTGDDDDDDGVHTCASRPTGETNCLIMTRSKHNDLEKTLAMLDSSFSKVVDRIQQAWANDSSRSSGQTGKRDKKRKKLLKALPKVENAFLETFKRSWSDFIKRFQQQMASGQCDTQLLCAVAVNVKKELLSYDSMFDRMELHRQRFYERDFIENPCRRRSGKHTKTTDPKLPFVRIKLPDRMQDFNTQRYNQQVTVLKSIPFELCKSLGDDRLRFMHSNNSMMILSEGFHFGRIEFALNANGNLFAVKKFSKNSEASIKVAAKLTQLIDGGLLGLDNSNVLPYTHYVEYTKGLWLVTPVCDYNLEVYIDMMYKRPSLYSLNIGNAVKQIVNGMKFLHQSNPPIVHGNLKPSNVLIGATGCIHLADFGMTEILYKVTKPRSSDIIWWSRETWENFDVHAKIVCNKETDIQTLGMIIHYTLTRGTHPFGQKLPEININKKKGRKCNQLKNVEHFNIVDQCLNKNPSKRPAIDAISQHVFFWSDQKKWDFLMTCVRVQYLGISDAENSLSKKLDKVALNNWNDYLNSIGLKNAEEVGSVNYCMPSKFLYCISNDTLTMVRNYHYGLKQLSADYLTSFPTLPFAFVKLIKNTDWSNMECFQQYFNSEN